MEVKLLTMIDPATGWVEIAELPTKIVDKYNKKDDIWYKDKILDKDSSTISRLFNKHWLSRYPRPRYVTCDNGGEFKLHLAELCKEYSIGRKPTSSRNPQANAIIERMHGVLNNMLRTSGINSLDEVTAERIDEWVSTGARCRESVLLWWCDGTATRALGASCHFPVLFFSMVSDYKVALQCCFFQL
jgi:hypothetical protein